MDILESMEVRRVIPLSEGHKVRRRVLGHPQRLADDHVRVFDVLQKMPRNDEIGL